MEVIFSHQILHQRDVIGTIGRARRKWKRLYSWFPEEQRRLRTEMERVYKETIEQYGEEIFMEYTRERRLNKRLIKKEHEIVRDKIDYEKFDSLKPILDKFDRFPLLYYQEECGTPDFCQQDNNAAI